MIYSAGHSFTFDGDLTLRYSQDEQVANINYLKTSNMLKFGLRVYFQNNYFFEFKYKTSSRQVSEDQTKMETFPVLCLIYSAAFALCLVASALAQDQSGSLNWIR